LLGVPDVLHADELLALARENQVVGRDVRVFQETSSTNDVVEKLARDGAKEGVVVFAEAQTKGRGRLGRAWVSPARKGLWFSVLLRPDLRPQEATRLTVVAAVALTRALRREAGVTAHIKWPNDILLQGKKLAGVLTELSAELDHIRYLILGLGLNVNLAARDWPIEVRTTATSLLIETGRTFRRADLAAALLRELDDGYAQLGRRDFRSLAEEWEAQCSTLGHQVTIRVGNRVIVGGDVTVET
jgi:BirA family biotin operon repressor/biotin-[acetyl-CoA-carboxylase] ligase